MQAFWRVAVLLAAALPLFSSATPAAWVPARWQWDDPKTLELLRDTPINCLLLNTYNESFVQKAATQGIAALAVIEPGADTVERAQAAARAKLDGIVLEGVFPEGTARRVKDSLANSKMVVVELTTRSRLRLDSPDPVIGTFQGVWPGIQVLEDGHAKAGPTGSPWIDTNSGFVRAVRAWGNDKPIWIGNRPPAKMAITGERYLQAIADAAIVGARWILALDADFSTRLQRGDAAAIRDWKRMGKYLQYFEEHRDWQAFPSYGKLAVVQDPASGGLLSGGILDMIAAKHTPVRPIPRQHLTPDALKCCSMAVNVDSESLTPEQREILRGFTRSGGTLLTGPPIWKDATSSNPSDQITLEKAELERLNDIWRDVQSMIGRKNLGARLFNVSSMLSNLQASDDGKHVLVQLVNYSSYPVENVTVHLVGKFTRARVITPESGETAAEVYAVEDGTGVDIEKVSVCAAVLLDY